jgi:predicted nucleotidyltransferase
MNLTRDEQAWLDSYRQALADQFPGLVEEVLVFGSKARGEAGPDSDLDVLVIIREGDSKRKREVRRVGHMLAVISEAVPSIMVYTRQEWTRRERGGSAFYQAVMRDRVRVA